MSDKLEDDAKRPVWAEAIRLARVKARLSQTKLAEELGISQSTITAWETGKLKPQTIYWRDLQRILGSDLYGKLTQDYGFANTPSGRVGALSSYDRYNTPDQLTPFMDLQPSYQFTVLYERLFHRLWNIKGIDPPLKASEIVTRAFQIWSYVTTERPPRVWETVFTEEIEFYAEFFETYEEKYGKPYGAGRLPDKP